MLESHWNENWVPESPEAHNPIFQKNDEIKADNTFYKSRFFPKHCEQRYRDAGMAEDSRKLMLILNTHCCGSEPLIFPVTLVWHIGKGCSTDKVIAAI